MLLPRLLYHIAIETDPYRLLEFGNLQQDVGLRHGVEYAGQLGVIRLALPAGLVPAHLLR